MINIKIAVREAVVSNFDTLKAFIIGMSQKGLLESSDKVRRIDDSTPQYSGPLQFDSLLHMVQQTSAWPSKTLLLTWLSSPPQFSDDHIFTALVEDGPCSYLHINIIDELELEAYSPTGEWVLAAASATSHTPALADAKDCIAVCTNCNTGTGLFRHLLCGQPHNPLFCDQPCCMCNHPPNSHAEHCIQYKGWLHTQHPEWLLLKQLLKQMQKQPAQASLSTSAVHCPFCHLVKEISRWLTADEGAALATVVGSQSQLLVMATNDNPDRCALTEDRTAHNTAHHDKLFHIIKHTDSTH